VILEAALAAQVVAAREAAGFDVYAEVRLDRDGPRADVVERLDDLLDVIECKRELSLELLAQADRWRPYANRVFIAIPSARRSLGRDEGLRLCRSHYGFGVLDVGDGGVVETMAAVCRERVSDDLLARLRPEHKTHVAAGSSGGACFTEFRATADALAAFVDRHPGCTLTEAVAAIPHHYRSRATAEERLAKMIRKDGIPGVFTGWRKRLWATAEEARRGTVT
jgi:hypothetical protein